MEKYFSTKSHPQPDVSLSSLLSDGIESRGIASVLEIIRQHLEMDIAFISRFEERDGVMQYVTSRAVTHLEKGLAFPLQESYCQLIMQGELPEMISDTRLIARAQQIPATHQIPIGAHLSVPIVLSNHFTYGMLCCFSHQPNEALDDRALVFLRTFAKVIAIRIEEAATAERLRCENCAEIEVVLKNNELFSVYQPIVRVSDNKVIGVEALSRFNPPRRPDKWFELARSCEMGARAELAAIKAALRGESQLPLSLYIGLNCSPDFLREIDLLSQIGSFDPKRIILELTEHAIVENYTDLNDVLKPLRKAGIRVAVDDTGAGYSSMRHILSIEPNIIKLDMSLVRNIDRDKGKRALAKALINFAKELESSIVAEGVETQSELLALIDLGVETVQGFYFSKPVFLSEIPLSFANHEVSWKDVPSL